MSRLDLCTKLATGLAFTALVIGSSALLIAAVSKAASGQLRLPEVTALNMIEQQGEGGTLRAQLLTQQQPKTALVIGNAAYSGANIDSLSTPVNDATDIADVLRSLGFEVILLTDSDWESMYEAIDRFGQQLQAGGVGVFYYAGHGVQVDGENFIIPIDAQLNQERDVRREAIPLSEVLRYMEASDTDVNVVIVDACRSNAFVSQWWRPRSRDLSAEGGLAQEIPPEGTVVSFSTSPGSTADDGTGRNSPYTASLLQHIKTENIDIAEMFRQVRVDVLRQTDEAQIPWYQESLVGRFSFNPTNELATAPNQPPTNPPTQVPEPATQQTEPEWTPEPRPTSSPTEPTLISATTGVNYQPLRDALAAGDFRKADEETTSLMLQAADIEREWLQDEDVSNFSCEDLRIIDQLWLDHSAGRFGFSVQQEIYQNLGGTSEYNLAVWRSFTNQVGWSVNNEDIDYENSTFSTSAPEGHLPFGWRGVDSRWGIQLKLFPLSCGDM